MTGRRGRFVLEQARVFDAPAERIFGLLTEPSELGKWWRPHGFTTPEIQLDLRVGGGYRFTMQPPDANPFHLSGDFPDVRPSERLSFTFRWEEPDPDEQETVVGMSLDSLGPATTVSLTQAEFATEARLELHRHGWADSSEKLDSVLKSERS